MDKPSVVGSNSHLPPSTNSKHPRSLWPVRTFLIWLILACLLPGFIGACLLIMHDYRNARVQQTRDTIQTAHALTQAVDNHLLKAIAVANLLATSESLSRHDLPHFHRRARNWIATGDLGTAVVLLDEDGRQILNTLVDFGQPLPAALSVNQDLLRRVFQTGKTSISNVFVGQFFKHLISVNVPVMIDGKVDYVLSVGLIPEEFTALLKAQNLPPDWVAAVIDSSGSIVGRTHTPEKFIGTKVSAGLLQALQESPEGSRELITVDGIPVDSLYSRSPATNWSVAIGIPRQSIHSDLILNLSLLAAGLVIMFCIGLLLAVAISKKIANSVRVLIAPAIALGNGEPALIPRVHIKEAAEVALALGRASHLLQERAAALQTSQAELAEAHHLAKFGTWYCDLRTGELQISEAVRDMFGRDDTLTFNELLSTFLPTEDWQIVNAASKEVVRTGEGFDLDLRVNHRNGHTLWINTKSEGIRNEQGEVVALRGTLQDITERKHADQRLRESEERFRLMADNIAQMAWMADGAGAIFWYNQRWFDYTGTTLEEMQGLGWQKVQHPDHLDRVVGKYRHCLETGEPWEDTFPLKGADGNYRWFLSRAIPERDASTSQVLRWFGTNTDITEQRRIEEDLRKFKFFSHHAGDMHLLIDQTGQIRYANKLACTRLGYSDVELLSLNIADINPPRPGHSFREIFVRSQETVIPPFEGIHRDRSGATFPVEITATILELNDGWQMFTSSRDITERKHAEERVREASLHDLLTGLPNRALIFEYCNHLLAAAQRRHSEGALLFIDLDRFKPVNDLYGHEIGDRVLQEVARRLVGCTREEDIVGRLGGDEFVIALPYISADRQRAVIVAQHVIDHLSEPFLIDTLEISLSPSIGISYFPKHASEVGSLIHAADLAMYQAKQSGRANYHVYTAELDRRADQALSVEMQLKHALKNESLQLYYQPVIDIRSGQVISAEALLRLPESNGSEVGPDRFIPVAESAGLIGDLGEWVAVEACRQHEMWQREGLQITIAINVSPLQFRQRAFAANLRSIISNSRIDPACLEIEVTESTVMENVDDAVNILNKIKSFGVKVSLDDFGTGYSSLGRLSTLPLDKLKVDQSFVKRIEYDPASRAVTQMIIALGHSMRLDVVGEGVESEDALNYLRSLGCNQAQGYWFSQPLTAVDFAQWYRVRKAEVSGPGH